jgi:hypothetical protein
MKTMILALALSSLPAWANHHDFGDHESPPPEICVEWQLTDGGMTDAGSTEEVATDAGVELEALSCTKKEPATGCSSVTGGTMLALVALTGLLRRRR